MATISIYKNVKQTETSDTVLLSIFLDAVQSGKWQDAVLKIRMIQDEGLRRSAKADLPNVTISGVFGKRVDNDCKLHSGFIAIDLDNLGNEVEGTRELLKTDPYVYSAFTSVSGTGLCLLVKIDPENHRRAFEGIADYLIKKYQIIVDPTGINQSRTRFVSWDPELFINEQSLTFKKYLPKEKKRKVTSAIFVQNEFDAVVEAMVSANVSCVEDYRDWRDIAFGLADQFGEGGRQYFHRLSSCSNKYESSMCDRQYSHAIARNGKQTNKITIATIYWFARQAGINTNSPTTSKIAAATSTMKRAGLGAADIAKNLEKFEGITNADEIIQQAFEAQSNFAAAESIVENIRMWLRRNYSLMRNSITRKIECDGEEITDIQINTMYLDAKVIFNDLNFELFSRVIFSKNTPDFNPVIAEFSADWDGYCRIEQLAKCINSKTGTAEWREKMLIKWLVGIVHAIYGGKNELNFILVGGKNTGKTEFFRRLLPDNLTSYFAESQLNRGKDDEILMCEKLIIFNDEYGGKNKMDERNEKRLMASDVFSLREPYGRANITLKRLATLCGTCNEKDVLDDPTGNRRIIIMEAAGKFDYELYNSLDKLQVFLEAKELWREGERPILDDNDIITLEQTTDGEYSKVSFEQEMIEKYFMPPEKTNPWDFMTTSEIKLFLESHTKEKININKLGARLRKIGYTRSCKDRKYGYDITPVVTLNIPS
jgi:predicted P-loop ATPase